MATYNQPTNEPTNKVAAAGVGGAAAIVIVWLLGLAGVEASPEVAAALATLLAFGAGYLAKEKVPLTK